MLETFRRIITVNKDDGRSTIQLNDAPGNILELEGSGLGDIWQSALNDPLVQQTEDPTKGPMRLEPDKGHVKFRYFLVPPEPKKPSAEERQAQEELTAMGFEMVGASHCRVDTTRHPAMHKTETLDYIIVLRGEVTLLLDDDDVQLKQGDVVVQQATNHAWVNHGEEPAVMIAVLIDTA